MQQPIPQPCWAAIGVGFGNEILQVQVRQQIITFALIPSCSCAIFGSEIMEHAQQLDAAS